MGDRQEEGHLADLQPAAEIGQPSPAGAGVRDEREAGLCLESVVSGEHKQAEPGQGSQEAEPRGAESGGAAV